MLSLTTGSNQQQQQQIERRRQLESRLERDYEEVEALQQSLSKTNIFADKVVCVISCEGRDVLLPNSV